MKKITELIAELTAAKERHGDIGVKILTGFDPWESAHVGVEIHATAADCFENKDEAPHVTII